MIKATSFCLKLNETVLFSKPYSQTLPRYLLGSQGPSVSTDLPQTHLPPTPCLGPQARGEEPTVPISFSLPD